MNQKRFILILIFILLAIAALGRYLIYQNQTKPTSSPPIIHTFSGTQTITVKDGYSFSITIPEGYKFVKERYGSYHGFIRDSEDKTLLGFSFWLNAGERSPIGEILVDNVPFTLEGGETKMICGSSAHPGNFNPTKKLYVEPYFEGRELLFFEMYAWCENRKGKISRVPNPEKEKVIGEIVQSITFSPQYKEILTGRVSPPSINSHKEMLE